MLVFMLTILLTYEKACGIIPLWSSDLHWRVQTADPQHIELCSLPLSTEYILQVNYDPKARKINSQMCSEHTWEQEKDKTSGVGRGLQKVNPCLSSCMCQNGSRWMK